MATIIKNGKLVTAADTFQADLKIEKEKISMISNQITGTNEDKIIDATGKYVFPGLIDPHTHLDIDGTLDDFESGTAAAAGGGVTTIINYTDPDNSQTFLDDLNQWKKKAETSLIDYGFHSIINRADKDTLEQISKLPGEGVTSIKLFMAYKENMVNDEQFYNLLKTAKQAGIVTNLHAENGHVIDMLIDEALEQGNTDPIYHALTRPPSTEAEATARALRIAEIVGAPIYIVHLSSAEAATEFVRAKERGVLAFGETCPQYLVLNESYLKNSSEESVKYICSPPLRTKADQEVLWKEIKLGSISTIGSDHASHPFINGKDKGINDFTKAPNGLPGIESTLLLLHHYGVCKGKISLPKLVEITSKNTAEIFGLYPKKGNLNVGSDGDIVIFDPSKSSVISEKTQKQGTEYNVYDGMEVQGYIDYVLSRGEVIVQDNEIIGKSGRGKYLYRSKFSC